MLSLKTMLYVVTAAKMSSFTKAADTLYVSQSSISQAIKALEEDLGATIFIRQSNRITLTKAGEIFVNEAEKLLERCDQLKKRIAEMSDTRHIMHLGLSTFYSKYYLPILIPQLERKLAEITFNFTEDISHNLEDMVESDILDFCMVPLPLSHHDLTAVHLREEEIMLAVPPTHRLVSEADPDRRISLSEVKEDPFVFLKSFQRFTDLGISLCKQSGFLPNVVYESMNWETIDALVAQGIGVSLVPDVVTTVKSAHKPVYFKLDTQSNFRPYALAFKSSRAKEPEMQEIIRCIQDSFSSINQ